MLSIVKNYNIHSNETQILSSSLRILYAHMHVMQCFYDLGGIGNDVDKIVYALLVSDTLINIE